jgi:hypothetical protein
MDNSSRVLQPPTSDVPVAVSVSAMPHVEVGILLCANDIAIPEMTAPLYDVRCIGQQCAPAVTYQVQMLDQAHLYRH